MSTGLPGVPNSNAYYSFMLVAGLSKAAFGEQEARLNVGLGYVKWISIRHIRFYKEFKVHHR